MKGTREKILLEAKHQFNKKGYNSVSIKDIADALGISKGNLTYYFKKKEDIVEAILEMPTDQTPPSAPRTYEELTAFFEDMQSVVENNAFYFLHHAQLSQLSDYIRRKQSEVYTINCKKLLSCFEKLKDQGIFREEAFEGEYKCIIDSLLISCIYWLPFCEIKGISPSENSYKAHAENTIKPIKK
ncbi:MAG: TetR/AcrR family transcriptional regulator [Firmicutes bacterium]|nr:TetR/AcrR family transcriptional regulator [Clostridiales bacterium]MBQ4340747.1 TetR/AcrR family transcriptional regulator [Bacillota bacterium]